MPTATYETRRSQLLDYFDRTAVEAWKRLTSDAPVSGIRATVREGRERMRATLLSWLPQDLSGRRVLDAGCGTGALAVEAAKRGAEVVAVDLSPTLVGLARERAASAPHAGRIAWVVGDMLDPALGTFDHVVAMDSLIHYRAADVVRVLAGLAARSRVSLLFTFAPRTALLSVMHAVGRAFPKSDRAPSIEPVAERTLRRLIAAEPALADIAIGRTERIHRGFYTSQAMELARR
ncbi:magnesium protoporphyrin IX methyltransferase [Elioraea thermophila]|uniref:magnesium protoporphyrin IX methyltransferase n=1 Tax=Elioraea thermophila TaxID=2185104 RepID=UPI000DF3092B|nr:magnesium protoporphyrin IX methyltransferase [Elioraea thermophila]